MTPARYDKLGIVSRFGRRVQQPTMMESPPSIHRITADDLRDNERLAVLYVNAVQHGYWDNSPQAALEFATLAEKALADDTHDTPGALFVSLLKATDGSTVTQAAETRAMQRWPSHVRQELVDAAGPEPELPGTPVTPGDVEDALAIADVGYTHAVMVQCFFPQRPISGLTYDTTHGRASLSIEAGRLIKPDVFGEIIQCAVPSGAKARLILPYIIGEAVRTASPEIDLGRSLRTFMERLGMPVGGSNGQKITAEIQNIAAATIMLGEWADDRARMRAGRMAKELSFWLERNPDQQSFWTPTMTLSAEFFAAIQDHRVPINMHHLAHLARSPRRMDLYAWLAYRTPRIRPRHRAPVSLYALHTIFAPDITRFLDFRKRLRSDLAAIAAVYPHFKLEVSGDVVWLERSPPPVPYGPNIHRLPR